MPPPPGTDTPPPPGAGTPLPPGTGTPPGRKKRILVLCGDDACPIAAANIYADTFREHEVRFIEEKILTLRRFLVFSQRRLKRLGALSLLGTYLLYLEKFIRGEKRQNKRYTPALLTADLSSDPAVARFLRDFDPDLIIIGFCGLLSPAFLRGASRPIYNTHPGINPKYRGFGNVWAFYHNDFAFAGYTVHKVDEGTDTGGRVALARLSFDGVPFAEHEVHAAQAAARRMAALALGEPLPEIPEEFRDIPSACHGIPTWFEQRRARKNYEAHYAPPGKKGEDKIRQGCRMTTRTDDIFRHILITGAGGGLGRALALAYAGPDARLTLWGRNEERLAAVEEECRAKGALTRVILQDVRALPECRELLAQLDEECPVDLAFLNAGVSSGALPGGGLEPVEDACRTLEVNALASVNMLAFLLERMRARKSGHLVCIASLAALYPLPGSPAYCASKAALACFARAVRSAAAGQGTRISIVYPGYVDTPMSRRLDGPQPLRVSAEKAAVLIRSRLEAGADNIVFPRLLALGIRCLHLLPQSLADFFAARFGFTIRPDAESPAAKKK